MRRHGKADHTVYINHDTFQAFSGSASSSECSLTRPPRWSNTAQRRRTWDRTIRSWPTDIDDDDDDDDDDES